MSVFGLNKFTDPSKGLKVSASEVTKNHQLHKPNGKKLFWVGTSILAVGFGVACWFLYLYSQNQDALLSGKPTPVIANERPNVPPTTVQKVKGYVLSFLGK